LRKDLPPWLEFAAALPVLFSSEINVNGPSESNSIANQAAAGSQKQRIVETVDVAGALAYGATKERARQTVEALARQVLEKRKPEAGR
jgi:hypothetical protein